ncbi:MAG TPA: hypothetical protein VGN83_04985 [Falsiroseomonas sp.]|jgi:hypothetical protein|nr:hypothetical protein [Falsiroseomonas sp.]
MSDPADRFGWLPVAAKDALEAEKDKASTAEADRLLSLDPRARVLALLEHLRPAAGDAPPALRPADLVRILESFPGDMPADAGWLVERFPDPPPA